jgi:hypothetical protein
MAKSQVLPPTFPEIIISIGGLSDADFETLKQFTNAVGFNPKSSDFEKFRNRVGENSVDNKYLVAALAFLHERLSEITSESQQFDGVLQKFVDDVFEEKPEGQRSEKSKVFQRLSLLLQASAEHIALQKRKRLSLGFLPNALNFSSFVDLRPNFHDEDLSKPSGYVPMIQFRIRTDSGTPGLKSFVFQMDVDTLEELKKAIDRVEKKLASVESVEGIGPLIAEKKYV